VPEHSQALPVLQLLFDILRRSFGLEPQRMAAKVDRAPSRAVERVMELIGEAGQRYTITVTVSDARWGTSKKVTRDVVVR